MNRKATTVRNDSIPILERARDGMVKEIMGCPVASAKSYGLHVTLNIPVRNNWLVAIYDTLTRSMLQTSQRSAGINSLAKRLKKIKIGAFNIYFGPKASKEIKRCEKSWDEREIGVC